jgi:hypothetical protein
MMVQQVTQLSTGYPQLEKFVEDERVFCYQCSNAVEVEQRQSMPAEQMERHRKVNAKPLQWMFDQAKVRNGWATVTWTEHQCSPTGFAVFPSDVKHRCHLFQAKPSAVESEEWWLT